MIYFTRSLRSVCSSSIARCCWLAAVSIAAWSNSAIADGEVWSFDLTTTGNDVFWTSPTATDTNAASYIGEYEITLVAVTGTWIGIPIGPLDVTDEVPKEDRIGSAEVDGPPPISLLDDSLVFPEPPEPSAIAADVKVELNADGFGQVSITNVELGTVDVEVSPFGTVTVQITSVRVAGTVVVKPLGPVGDLNNDGVVDGLDLLILLSAWGECANPNDCPADINGDGTVDGLDLLILLSNWG